MPIPKPKENETNKDFMNRCMSDIIMVNEYPDASQRAAVCQTQLGRNNKMKVIELTGVVGYEITAQGLKNKLPKDGSDVLLKVDSPGGSVYEGNRLYNAIKDYNGKISVEIGALAASAASYFPLAAGKENIKARANSVFMIHKAWAGMWGNSDELKAEAEILDGFDRIMAKAYAKATGKTVDECLDDMTGEKWMVGGQAILESGFASGVLDDDMGNESEEEKPVPMEKAEVQARIEEAKLTLRNIGKQEDLDKWAARIHADLNKVDVDRNGQALLFEETAPGDRGKNNKEEDMDFNAYLSQNPEHKAEFEKQRNEFAKASIDAALKSDRERCSKITKLFGNSEKAMAAISSGKSVGELAVEERESAMSARENVEAQDMGGLEVRSQVPEKPVSTKKTEEIKAQDSALDRFFPNSKKEAK